MARLRQFPAFVILLLIASGLMLRAGAARGRLENWPVARGFLDHALFFGLLRRRSSGSRR